MEPLRHVNNPRFTATLFRRTYPQITQQGGLWDEANQLYPLMGARPNQSDLVFNFPSGANVAFAHLIHDKTRFNYQGGQLAFIGFDELTHFSHVQFWYMLSRLRSMSGVVPYARGTCNPDPDSFVAKLIDWWIGEDGYPVFERSGVLRWFYRINDDLHFYATRADAEAAHPALAKEGAPKSLTFIPARLEDNAILIQKDPAYKANLLAQPLVEQERLLKGNWKIRPAAGKVFNRAWFGIVDAAPVGGVDCRGWDFAATEASMKKEDPDYTSGVKVRMVNGKFFILDMIAFQEGPAEVERIFINTSRQDAHANAALRQLYRVRFEREPGSAAKREGVRLIGLLAGIDARMVDTRMDKLARAQAFAAQAQAGNVYLVKGAWNERWLNHMHAIPDGAHDDIMDATTTAFNDLVANPAPPRGIKASEY